VADSRDSSADRPAFAQVTDVEPAAATGPEAPPARGPATPRRWRRALEWWRARPTLAAALIYALLSVIMVGQGLLPGRTLSASDSLFSDVPWLADRPASVRGLGANFELADPSEVFQPFLKYTRGQVPNVPLWNPYISGGRPYLADAQSAIFSPFNVPAYILPFWNSLAVIAALKLFVGALGAFALGRCLGMRFGGALLAGTVFAFGTFFIVWLSWPLTNIFPLMPWLLVLADLVVKRPGPLPAAGLGGLVALTYFGGHPETTFHALFLTGVFFLFRLLLWARRNRPSRRAFLRPVMAFAFAFLAGTAVAAIMLVPFAELLRHSNDLARRKADGQGHWPRKYLGALFLHDYWGRPTQSDIEPFMQIRGWYAGALTLMLTPVALLVRPTVQRVAIAVFAVFAAMVVLGYQPVFGLVTSLPGFSSAHNERMLIFCLLALALLAGWGLDELSGRRPLSDRQRRAVLVIGAGLFCVPLVWMTVQHTLTTRGLGSALKVAWGFVHPPPINGLNPNPSSLAADIVRMSSLFQWLVLAGLGLVLMALRLRRSRPLPAGAFVALAIALLVVDLFRANMGFNPAIPTRHAAMPTTGSIRYLQSQRPNRFVGVSGDIHFQPLPADTAMYFGLYDARGYDYPAEKRYDTMWRRNVAPGVPDFAQPIELATATRLSLPALDLLSVRDLLIHNPITAADVLHLPGLSVAYRGPDGEVYRNSQALPRVFVVDRQQTVHGAGAALAAATAPAFDRQHVVVTESPVSGLGQAATRAASSPGTARLVSYGAQRVVAQASVTGRSMFVLTDVFYPGWKVTVDGRAEPIHRVDYLLRGVVIPPGTHRIEFRYEPASFRAGWIITIVGLIALASAALIGLRMRRSGSSGLRASDGPGLAGE
jgi:Bacterial membrane protein YfhO